MAMAQFDPETLIVLQKALDAAWAAVPDQCKSETRRSELAQLILKLAADGARHAGERRARSVAGPIREVIEMTTRPAKMISWVFKDAGSQKGKS